MQAIQCSTVHYSAAGTRTTVQTSCILPHTTIPHDMTVQLVVRSTVQCAVQCSTAVRGAGSPSHLWPAVRYTVHCETEPPSSALHAYTWVQVISPLLPLASLTTSCWLPPPPSHFLLAAPPPSHTPILCLPLTLSPSTPLHVMALHAASVRCCSPPPHFSLVSLLDSLLFVGITCPCCLPWPVAPNTNLLPASFND